MAPSSTPAARQLKPLWSRLGEFAPVLGALAVALVLLRGYEGLLIVGEHALPGGAWTSFFYGVLFELAVAADLQAKLRNFKRMNCYVMQNDRLIRGAGQPPAKRSQVQQEDSLLAALGLEAATVVDLFGHARQRAFDQEYREARILLRRTLRQAPETRAPKC